MSETLENYCDTCDKTYKNKKSLLNHNYKYHNNKEYNCDKCNKKFTNYQSKYRHVKKCNIDTQENDIVNNDIENNIENNDEDSDSEYNSFLNSMIDYISRLPPAKNPENDCTIISTLSDKEIEDVVSLQGDALKEKMLEVLIVDKVRKYKDYVITDSTFSDVYYFNRYVYENQLKKIDDDILSDYMLFTSSFDIQIIWDVNVVYFNKILDNLIDKYLDITNNDVSVFTEKKYFVVFLNVKWFLYKEYIKLK